MNVNNDLTRGLCLLAALLGFPAQASEQDEEDTAKGLRPVSTSPASTAAAATGNVQLLSRELSPGTTTTLYWNSQQLLGATTAPIPVLVTRGKQPGPVACLTSAIHGDELNGIEINRRVAHQIQPEQLAGTLISVPVVNVDGLLRRDRYLSDRRDLNRSFPGDPQGSTAARVAYSLFENIIRHCDFLIDMHTGSHFRENLPQLRADLTIPAIAELSQGFGSISVLQSASPPGSLRSAATAAGIPAVVMEVGGPLSLDEEMVALGVKSVRSLLSAREMISNDSFWSSPQPVFYQSSWVRAEQGGILINKRNLGDRVNTGALLGIISDPITNAITEVLAPFDAVILGRAQNQFVSPGYALFHLGRPSSLEALERQGEVEKRNAVETAAEQLGIKPPASTAPSSPPPTTDLAPKN
ncbi:succinylglutamate desuccinylase/aspartoacylase family protein [Motiliproteus sediminis]|uniref:succinylglutamate desuccinylase/aspartoacylase family protein n=1 Tax=Motiliproteus sediminis TaxID=1468178 RepID=UPI001AF00A8C|nr:succinylglutamate desuccinylase/aspartoacylase family protein [Motiliproteus sediminis]